MLKSTFKSISNNINKYQYWSKNYISIIIAKVKLFFGYEYDKAKIPNGLYCYSPDMEKNKNKQENDYSYYIIPCPYYKTLGKYNNGCKYLGCITNDFIFGDQCKICGENEEWDDNDD